MLKTYEAIIQDGQVQWYSGGALRGWGGIC